jgi:hypothetical protein
MVMQEIVNGCNSLMMQMSLRMPLQYPIVMYQSNTHELLSKGEEWQQDQFSAERRIQCHSALQRIMMKKLNIYYVCSHTPCSTCTIFTNNQTHRQTPAITALGGIEA